MSGGESRAPSSTAVEALTRVEAHELVCGDRYKRIENTLQEIRASIRGLYDWRFRAACAFGTVVTGGFFWAFNKLVQLGAL